MKCEPNCPICAQIELCERREHPRLLAETSAGWAVMGESQMFRGYSLLLCKSPARELFELEPHARGKYLQEMALLAQAVFEVVQPRKLNYESLGNIARHGHWHVLPRHHDGPEPRAPVWGIWDQADQKYFYDEARDGKMRAAISARLRELMG